MKADAGPKPTEEEEQSAEQNEPASVAGAQPRIPASPA